MSEADNVSLVPAEPTQSGMRADVNLLRAAPEVVLVTATSMWRVTTWSLKASVGASTYVARRAIAGDSASEIIAEATSDLRSIAWRALGLGTNAGAGIIAPARPASARASTDELRAEGAALLRRSASLTAAADEHPAYARILTELAPDEARILRFLYAEGPQPSIDVRTGRPLGIGSQLVAGGLNMIAEHSGCRNPERIHPYLTNLHRLGMLQFSKEQVEDPSRYQLVEAQPAVVAVIKKAGFAARLNRRSICLNTFGKDFCRMCLPVGSACFDDDPH